MRRLSFLAGLVMLAMTALARADSTVQNIPTNATSPLPANSCFYVAQFVSGAYGDAKLCSGYLTALGASAMATATATAAGDLTGTWPTLTVAKVNGQTFPSGFASHQTPVFTGSGFAAVTIPNCLDTSGQHINYSQSLDSWVCGTSGGGVTSVGLAVPAASIFTATGTPVTTFGTLGFTTTGTSGGVPYFSSASALSSSAALTANLPVIGGGAGTAPSVGSRSGNTTTFATTSGSLLNTHCVSIDASGNLVDFGAACGGTGTVTSVAFTVPAASILGISGTPITTSGTLALTTAGTSGGVPYFSSASALSSSAALTANLPVIGGGAGVAPSVGTRSGNTTAFATVSGALTNGHCVAIDASSNFVDSGGACGGSGGTGTVTSVGLTVPGASILSVTGSPVTVSGNIALATTGTSGGVPYFSSASVLSSSAALTANLPVIGGGAGSSPTVGTVSGNTTKFVTTTGALINGHCVGIDASGNFINSGGACGGSGGTGTVTSVGISVPGASIFGVTGSPVTISGTIGITTTGTSGGVPYFSSGSAISSSAALTANLPVIGGGAGSAPTVGTVSGNTTVFATASGALTNNHCVRADASGNIVDAGAACGPGTVTSVGFSVPGASIFGTTGTPVTSSGTLGLTTTGNSGGVPYFSSASVVSSSAVLTANNPVIGGGAGSAPAVGSRSGSTTTFATTTGTLTSGHCAAFDGSGNLLDNGGPCGSGGSGTVTSVGLSVPGSSIFAVTGSPITVSGTLGLTTTGTSGGIPYFSSASVVASSAALTANAPVIGGGAGTAPSVGTRSGNTTVFATTSGALTNGHCIMADASGNLADVGSSCSTVNVGTTNNLAYYASSTNAVSPLATANSGLLVTSAGGVPSIGTAIPAGVTATTQAQTDNSTKVATTAYVKLQQWGIPIGWISAQDPNNAILISDITQPLTVRAINGRVEAAVGAAATVTIYRAPTGTACSGGVALHSGSFNANGTAAANQALTVTTTSLLAGDSLCLQTTGGANWTGGTGIGTVTVYVSPS